MQVRYTAIYKPTDTKLERLLTGYHASSCKGEVIQKKKQWHYKDAASRLLVDILHYIEFTREERLPKFMASTDRLAHWVNGYPRFAGQIELIPETAIFRRFGGLNAQNLLYLQAELAALEEQLHQQQIQDSRSGHPGKSNYAFSWYRLSTSEDDNDQRQLRLVYRIRETLKLYSTYESSEMECISLRKQTRHLYSSLRSSHIRSLISGTCELCRIPCSTWEFTCMGLMELYGDLSRSLRATLPISSLSAPDVKRIRSRVGWWKKPLGSLPAASFSKSPQGNKAP